MYYTQEMLKQDTLANAGLQDNQIMKELQESIIRQAIQKGLVKGNIPSCGTCFELIREFTIDKDEAELRIAISRALKFMSAKEIMESVNFQDMKNPKWFGETATLNLADSEKVESILKKMKKLK